MNTQTHIPVISAVLKKKGIRHVVIAPGSRNAPLIQSFYNTMPEACISIVDERSAGYFALGIALKTQTPVAVITTSGTAVLNLAPAVAEAYYQGVPLILITADRPAEWLDQQDNQTICQKNIFTNNSKAGFELPLVAQSEEDIWYTNRIVNQAYNIAVTDKSGPVHINVPLREPLYQALPKVEEVRTIEVNKSLFVNIDSELQQTWKNAEGIVIVCGQNAYNKKLETILNQVAFDSRVVVLAESTANVKGENILVNPDMLFQAYGKKLEKLNPDLVVYFGGQVISKRIKTYLRKLTSANLWYVSPDILHVDTFKGLTNHIQSNAFSFFSSLFEKAEIEKNSEFANQWNLLYKQSISKADELAGKVVFSDLRVGREIARKLLPADILFAGNSSVVRYLQVFQSNQEQVFANRGASGIDGCISTASGIASVSGQKVVVVVGDLSFIYDSNGLWNRNLPESLKIIVVNNNGGGIFSLLEGPSKQKGFTDFFEAYHPVSIKNISQAFGVQHFMCTELESFNEAYNSFYSTKGAAILELCTQSEINTSVFKNFLNNIKNNE